MPAKINTVFYSPPVILSEKSPIQNHFIVSALHGTTRSRLTTRTTCTTRSVPMSCPQLIQISQTAHMLSARTVQTAVLFSMKPVRAVSNTSRLILFMPRGLIRCYHGAAR